MRRAAAEDFAAVEGVGVVVTLDDRFRDEPGPWKIVPVDRGQEREKLAELSHQADATLVIAPETGGVLAERGGWVRAGRGRWLGSSAGAIDAAADKHDLSGTLIEAGVRTPPAYIRNSLTLGLPQEMLDELDWYAAPRETPPASSWASWRWEPCHPREILPGCREEGSWMRSLLGLANRGQKWAFPGPIRFPAVVKPIDGAGAVDTRRIASEDALRAEIRRFETELANDEQINRGRGVGLPLRGRKLPDDVLVQPYIPGDSMSASLIVDRRGRAHLVGVGRQDVVIQDNQFHYRGGTVPAGSPDLADEARKAIAAVPGLRGWIGVDFILEPNGRCCVLEINPRLTTSFVALRRLLPPGTLARTLLDAHFQPRRLDRLDLAAAVHASPPLTFRADGTILGPEEAPP